MLSRLLDGSRVSVLGSVQVSLVALVAGVVPGILSVYLGSVFEWVHPAASSKSGSAPSRQVDPHVLMSHPPASLPG